MLVLDLDCSTETGLTASQKVSSIWELVELKMLDCSYRTRTGISITTLAADFFLSSLRCLDLFPNANFIPQLQFYFVGLRPRLHEQIKPPLIAQILDPYKVTSDEFEQI